MDLLSAFVFDNSTYEVFIMRDDNDCPLFKAIDVGKVLGLKNFHSSISDFDEDEKVLQNLDTLGGEQKTTFLTEDGVLSLVMRSNKPIAKPFRKWIINVIKTISRTGEYKLQKEIDELKGEYDVKMKDSKKLVTEYKDTEDARVSKILVDGCKEKTLVYFGKIKTMEDGRMLIKIGCTKNMKVRLHGLKQEFGNMCIIRVFECDRQEAFENLLHKRTEISRYSYNDMINNLKRSNEVFCMTREELKRAITIAERNVRNFRIVDNKKRDIDEIISENPQLNTKIAKICKAIGLPEEEINDLGQPEYDSKRGHTTINGNKVQKYNENLELIETYCQIIDVMRVKQYSGFSRSGVDRACKDKTMYKGFRWAYLDRHLDDYTIQNIGETVVIKVPKTGYAATLTPDKGCIVEVFADFKQLGLDYGYKGSDAVLKRMKNNKPLDDGCFMARFSELDIEIQKEWLKNNELPEKKSNHTSIGIYRLDSVTKKILYEYKTQDRVLIDYRINRRTLRDAINGDIILRGYKWSYVDKK